MPDINMQHFGELQRNQHSIDVEIDASRVASPQQDFPMMLETPNSSNSMLNVVAMNEFGEQLPTEIEGIANDKNWVHLKDDVQSNINQNMKIFYGGLDGKPAADSTYGSQAVWGSDYKAIYHMNNDPNGDVADSIKDSTLNGNHGTPCGSMTSADLVDSEYGKGIEVDGVNDCIDITGISTSTSKSNFLFQYKTSVGASTDKFFYDQTDRLILAWNTNTNGKMGFHDKTVWRSIADAPADAITHIYVYNFNDVTNIGEIFQDGISIGSTTFGGTAAVGGASAVLCARYSKDSLYLSNGVLSEIRITDINPSSNYISTTHKNLNNPTASGNSPFYKSISKELNFAESLQSLGRAG